MELKSSEELQGTEKSDNGVAVGVLECWTIVEGSDMAIRQSILLCLLLDYRLVEATTLEFENIDVSFMNTTIRSAHEASDVSLHRTDRRLLLHGQENGRHTEAAEAV